MWFIPRLIANVLAYQKAFGPDRSTLVAGDVLAAYARFNSRRGGVPAGVQDGLAAIRQLAGSEAVTNHGGVLQVSAEELRRAACRDLQPFFGSRHSVRQFADAEVPREAIEAAVSMAMHTPSVCNRQSWRVHAYTEPELKAALLKLQNGNRGFGDQAAHVLVVTTDLETFTSVGERNQCWIDGGMFSMSLIWALHSLGLGTCCLNWSVEKETDAALREVAAIPESQAIMMMLAVGALPQTLTVARSLRRQPDDVLVFHTGTGP
ncbi:MAG: nitroreductase family protein, partial [Acidobacteria bacterium]